MNQKMMTLTRSIACPKCRGDLWDMWNDIAECANCGYERPWHRRNAKDDKVTPSQERAAQSIRRYFDGSKFGGTDEPTTKIVKWETILQENTGYFYISVVTGNSIWTKDGGHFVIGRRGGIKVLLTYRLTENTKAHEKHIAKMVGGEVGWLKKGRMVNRTKR